MGKIKDGFNLKFRKLFRHINRTYKDVLFKRCFDDRRDLLELYNALNGTSYNDAAALEITTLEDCIYMSYKNDLSFIIYSAMNLYEHQSTFNPNMPVRGVLYFAEVYEAYIKKHDLNIYGSSLVPLPEPKYVVFYNGDDNQPDVQTLRLSDAFIKNGMDCGSVPALECTADMLNINYGHNRELMEKCRRLHDYSYFIALIKRRLEGGCQLRAAVSSAMDQCINEGVLADILLKQKAEVFHMLLNEFDIKRYTRGIREEEQQKTVLIIQGYEKVIAEKDNNIAEMNNEIAMLQAEIRKLKEIQDKNPD